MSSPPTPQQLQATMNELLPRAQAGWQFFLKATVVGCGGVAVLLLGLLLLV